MINSDCYLLRLSNRERKLGLYIIISLTLVIKFITDMKLSGFNMKTEFSILGVMCTQSSAHLFLAFTI